MQSKPKEVEVILIPESEAEVWCETENTMVMNCPSNFYIINALGDRLFFKTKDRAAAQAKADELYGKGRYTVRTVKDVKGKSRLESGGQSVYATATRARPTSRQPK